MLLYVDSHYASPYAMSVFVALHEKQLPFNTTTLDLSSGAASTPAYAKLSLTHRVPTLVDDDFSLSESSAIAEYLDETYPGQALYPAGVKNRARARQVQAWLRSDFMPIRSERTTVVLFFMDPRQPLYLMTHMALLRNCLPVQRSCFRMANRICAAESGASPMSIWPSC